MFLIVSPMFEACPSHRTTSYFPTIMENGALWKLATCLRARFI